MTELLEQLGINWKLFLSQLVNFFILLFVLRAFVYKPVLNIIRDRSAKIKEGLDKAEEAGIRLKEVDEISARKIKEAEGQSVEIIKETEDRAKIMEAELRKKAEGKQKELMELVRRSHELQKEEVRGMVFGEAANLVKAAIIKTVELSPEAIDTALISTAVEEIRKES